MARRVVLVAHVDDPPDDRVHTWCVTNGFTPEVRRPFEGDMLGEPSDDLASTVLYGGPYDVYEPDLHPFLNDENRWIATCLDRGVPMLGICQGAQQIARHLGAQAGAADHGLYEFGYYEVSPTEEGREFMPAPLTVCQAHYHTFAIPEGGVCLAGNEAYPNQAFRFGDRVYGVQFHPEVTIEGFRRWQEAEWAHYGQPGAQTREEQDRLMLEHDRAMADWFYGFLAKLFGSAPS